jgi:hypothetical protein
MLSRNLPCRDIEISSVTGTWATSSESRYLLVTIEAARSKIIGVTDDLELSSALDDRPEEPIGNDVSSSVDEAKPAIGPDAVPPLPIGTSGALVTCVMKALSTQAADKPTQPGDTRIPNRSPDKRWRLSIRRARVWRFRIHDVSKLPPIKEHGVELAAVTALQRNDESLDQRLSRSTATVESCDPTATNRRPKAAQLF